MIRTILRVGHGSLRSKAGQARLRELRDALLALPVKELHAETFADGTNEAPQVCALGAWAWWKKQGDIAAAREMVPADADDAETFDALAPMGWPKLVVFDAIYWNDETRYVYETFEGPSRWPTFSHDGVRYGREETPAERYARVLEWVT
jgi:hypothetical protein